MLLARLSLGATPRRGRPAGDAGQAAVEFVALLPLLFVVLAIAWQAVLAGETAWEARVASRAAARAQAVGADPARAARAHLRGRLERGLRVTTASDGGVRVSLLIPNAVPGVHFGRLAARSHFQAQNG